MDRHGLGFLTLADDPWGGERVGQQDKGSWVKRNSPDCPHAIIPAMPLRLPFYAALLLAGCSTAGIVGAAAHAAAPPTRGNTTATDPDTSSLQDDIVVSGRRPHDLETKIPAEASLNATVIQALGAVDLTEVFKELSAELGTSPGAAGGPPRTPVVLVNGQRIAGFSSIKDFPPEAVDRIDVFPEKVALQYGYGADQRVVNVVLRDRYRALTLVGRYTAAPKSWRNVYRAKVDLVRIGEQSHWNVGLDFSHQDAVYAATTTAAAPPADGSAIPAHTYAAQDDRLTISGTSNRMLGTINAELTGSLDLDTLQGRPGLSQEDGALLTSYGLGNLINGPFSRIDRSVHAGTNLTLNGKTAGWRWSLIGKLDENTRETQTTSAIGTDLGAIMLPSPGLLGDRCTPGAPASCVTTTTRRGSGDLYVNGDLWAMPGGTVTTALRMGVTALGLHGDSALQSTALTRNDESAQANIDIPLSARTSRLGQLTIGANGEVHRITAFGTLGTAGASIDWQPIRAIDLLASYDEGRQAPTLLQLGEALLTTPDLREYDFVTATTTLVSRTEGGNGALVANRVQTTKLRVQAKPFPIVNLSLSAEYTLGQVRNPIITLTAATPAAMAAFPTRFIRQNGYLTALNVAPVNAVHRQSQQIRWGLNYSTGFGRRWLDKAGHTTDRRDQFQIALYDTWQLQDELVLASGQRALDLLHGDIIGDDGGTPAHRIELQTSVSTHAFSVDVSGVWQTPTTAKAGASSVQQLTFTQGITMNLRLQINLADQHWLTRIFPRLKGNLNISADNLLDAHLHAHDASGAVPSAYSEAYLNPTGRTLRITLRKRFR